MKWKKMQKNVYDTGHLLTVLLVIYLIKSS